MKVDYLETLVQTHQADLFRYLRYLGADSTLAEDLVQEAFLGAFNAKNTPPATEPKRVAGWLRAIARNLFFSHCRREKRNPISADATWLEQAEAVWDEETEGAGLEPHLEALRKCVSEVSERNRKMLKLRYSENRSLGDIATELSLAEEGVKSALRRVKEALRTCVKKRLSKTMDGECL